MANYTHDLIFKVGDDGSMFLTADLGVDSSTDELEYKILTTSEPLNNTLLEDFLEFGIQIKDMIDKYNGIKEITVKLKE